MKLRIDGHPITAAPGQTLLALLRQLGLDGGGMPGRPLAAKIAGEIFNLNYVPVRDLIEQDERVSIRRALAASGGSVRLIRYCDPEGRDVYARTAQFILFFALHRLYPGARVKMNCTVGNALYIEVQDSAFCVDAIRGEVQKIVMDDLPLHRRRMNIREAIDCFEASGQQDKVRLLSWRKENYFDVYVLQDFLDYYYGELAPSTGYLRVWDILPADGGFMFLFPDNNMPDQVSSYEQMPKFLSVSMEGERWCELMNCETVADLNNLVLNGKIRELIRVNEALHEKSFSQVADMVCRRNARIVMLAGPSSSGKTTSANRLAIQLRVRGKKPILMSLDDYYIDRDKILPGPDGKVDLEDINTIDTDLFRVHTELLLSGESVELPAFNFITGKREWHGRYLQLVEETVIIVEGLHALNPVLIPDSLDRQLIFRLYVSPLLPLNLDDHNRIPTSTLRLLRRIVRDYETRGATVEKTMEMWDSVRRGEKKWIFPFQETADMIFNSSTLYELAVLKKHIYPLLTAVEPDNSCYEQVRAVVKMLNYVLEADVDDEIPPTSLVREFIGGNSFYK